MTQLKDVLRALRSEKDAKQSTIASDLGLAQGTYSSYENGITPPTDTCIRIAQYYGVSLDYLLGLSNERKHVGGSLPAAFTELAKLAGDPAPTATDLLKLLDTAVQYYQKGAPCGDLPLLVINGFLDALRRSLNAAAVNDTAALLDSTNAAVVAALDLTKMPAALYETYDK